MLGLPVPRRLYDPISPILPFRSQGKPSPRNGDGIGRLYSLKQQPGPVMLTRLRQDAPSGSTGRIGLRRRLRPDKMATGDRGGARRAKTGLPRHSFSTANGFGAVPLGFATDAPAGSAGSFTFFAQPQSFVMKSLIEERQIGLN